MTARVLVIASVTIRPCRRVRLERTRGDVVLEWNPIMVTTISSQNPFVQARIAAVHSWRVRSGECDYRESVPYLDPFPRRPAHLPTRRR